MSVYLASTSALHPAWGRGGPALAAELPCRIRHWGSSMRLLPRLISPAGFLLALVFFLLPFAAVSCEVPGAGSVEASYTGVDLITNGEPTTTTTGEFTSDQAS